MKEVLFVDCCIRGCASRTKLLADSFLSALPQTYPVTRLDLMAEDLPYFKGSYFDERQRLLEAGDRSHPRFRYAHQFAQADLIVIDPHGPSMMPVNDKIAALVTAVHSARLNTRILMLLLPNFWFGVFPSIPVPLKEK